MITIKNLSKSFGQNKVIDNIDMNISQGETVTILGKSGIGKSVLLKCIVRLIEPDSGEIIIGDKEILKLKIKELNQVRKSIGFLFQSAALYDSMSVKENLSFPLDRHTDLSKEEKLEKVKEALEWVGLSDAINKYPAELSGGMRKRIGLARSLILKPKIMLYDEPTTGLDPVTTKEITKLILNMQEKFKMTSIVVTHDLIVATNVSDRICMLNDGKFIFQGSVEEIQKSEDKFIRNFLSDKISV